MQCGFLVPYGGRSSPLWRPFVIRSIYGQTLAVGGDDRTVHLYTIQANGLSPGPVLARHNNGVTAVAFAPDGKTLASADANKEVRTNSYSFVQQREKYGNTEPDQVEFILGENLNAIK